MAPRAALALALVGLLALAGFGAYLLNVPGRAIVVGSGVALVIILVATGRKRPASRQDRERLP